MKRFLRSKLFLSIAAFVMIASAIAVPFAGNIIHSHAQGPASVTSSPTQGYAPSQPASSSHVASRDPSGGFLVPATGQWVNTGITLSVKQTLKVSATGSWSADPGDGFTGPDGYTKTWPDNFLNLQDIGACSVCASTLTPHWGALIGYVGNNPPTTGSYTSTSVSLEAEKVFFIGSNYNVSMDRTGTLWLNFNDDAYSNNTGDNAGQVTATVTVTPGVPATALFKFPWDASKKLAYTGGPHAWIEPTRSGLDMSDGSTATHILAMADGVVTFVGQETCIEGPCNTVKVHHDNGWDVWYVHLSSFAPGIAPGVKVRQGTWLGNEGDSGVPGSVHIHIELRLNGDPVAWAGNTLEGWQIHQVCVGYDPTKNKKQNNAPCLTTNYNGYINQGSQEAVPVGTPPPPQFLLSSTNHEH